MMDQAPDSFFCFSPWVLGSQLAGNNDWAFEETTWYRANGTRQRMVDGVKAMPSYARKFSWDQPAQATFQADAASITQGQSTTLRWTTQNVTAVTLNGAAVALSGSSTISPAATTTYTLRATPKQGAVIEKTVAITVTATPAEPTEPVIADVSDQLPQYPRGNAPVGKYPSRALSEATMVVIHHTAWDGATPQGLATYLVDQRHWPGIGYHFMIMKDGTIYQTNHLETVSFHTYDGLDPYAVPPPRNWDRQSVGVAFVGEFDKSNQTPTPQQLTSGGKLCAWLLRKLNLQEDDIWGRCEMMSTSSPGCTKAGTTWTWKWRASLLTEIRKYLGPVGPEPIGPLYHYLLFWKHADDWAKEDWDAAQDYIKRFLPTCGFSVEEAKKYQHVSIVGGPFGVPESDEQALKAAGCQVERLQGTGFEGTAAVLKRMAAAGQRFLNP
jgi:hypothetical protein